MASLPMYYHLSPDEARRSCSDMVSLASCSVRVDKCAYFSVTLLDECRRMRCTEYRDCPPLIIKLAAVCRHVWAVIPFNSARSISVLKLFFIDTNGLPVAGFAKGYRPLLSHSLNTPIAEAFSGIESSFFDFACEAGMVIILCSRSM